MSPGAPMHRLTQTPCCSGHHQGRALAQPKGDNGIETKSHILGTSGLPPGHLVCPRQTASQNTLNRVLSSPLSQSLQLNSQVGPSCLSNSVPPGLSSRRQWGGDCPPGWQPPVVCSCRAVSFSKGMENSAGYTLRPPAWRCYQPLSLGTDATPQVLSTELPCFLTGLTSMAA